MSLLSSIIASVLEWILAKGVALGYRKYEEEVSENAAKEKAIKDAERLREAKDEESRKRALTTIIKDTFGDENDTTGSGSGSSSH